MAPYQDLTGRVHELTNSIDVDVCTTYEHMQCASSHDNTHARALQVARSIEARRVNLLFNRSAHVGACFGNGVILLIPRVAQRRSAGKVANVAQEIDLQEALRIR